MRQCFGMAFGWIMDDHRAQGIIADIRHRTKYKHAVKALKRERERERERARYTNI